MKYKRSLFTVLICLFFLSIGCGKLDVDFSNMHGQPEEVEHEEGYINSDKIVHDVHGDETRMLEMVFILDESPDIGVVEKHVEQFLKDYNGYVIEIERRDNLEDQKRGYRFKVIYYADETCFPRNEVFMQDLLDGTVPEIEE